LLLFSENSITFVKQISHPLPRAYGNFASFLGKYVREEKVCTLEEAIYKLAGLPAEHLKLQRIGRLKTVFLPISCCSTQLPYKTMPLFNSHTNMLQGFPMFG
jgi:hypothetical protein